jgi:hypothetical protein
LVVAVLLQRVGLEEQMVPIQYLVPLHLLAAVEVEVELMNHHTYQETALQAVQVAAVAQLGQALLAQQELLVKVMTAVMLNKDLITRQVAEVVLVLLVATALVRVLDAKVAMVVQEPRHLIQVHL